MQAGKLKPPPTYYVQRPENGGVCHHLEAYELAAARDKQPPGNLVELHVPRMPKRPCNQRVA